MLFGIIKGAVKGTKALATGGWKTFDRLGSHMKGVALTGGASIAGWKWMSTGHLPGEQLLNTGVEVVEKAGSAVSKGLDAVDKSLDYVNKGLDKMPELIHDTKAALNGGGTGQGGGLFGNLFGGISNLIGGLFNGGTGSMLGLVAGAFLLFGGFGWMGKIAGALLAALSLGLLGGNSQQQQALQQVPARQESRQDVIYPDVDTGGQDEPGHTIHRSR